jgi:phosphomethylpyrimidine synthase
VRDYAQANKLSEADALKKGMEEETDEFVKQGAQVYKKA